MITRVETVIVGAGQASLALSRLLTGHRRDHVVLERGRVAERWRSERWDSFRLLSPNWQTRLPGYRYTGPAPDDFMDKHQVVRFFEGYARSFPAPLLTGVTVTAVAPDDAGGWLVRTSRGRYSARNVVIATGYYDVPHVPAQSRALPPDIAQLTVSAYRAPHLLEPGAVLVVGAGPSGQQIASELALAGRRVYLAVGRHRPLPRRYRGRDVYWWMDRMGMLAKSVDQLAPGRRPDHAPSVVLAGGMDLDLHRLVGCGVTPLGRLTGVSGTVATFAGDLPERVAEADANVTRIRAAIDAHIAEHGLGLPPEETPAPAPANWAHAAPRTLDLRRAGVTTVIWATGYRRNHNWVHAPVFDTTGPVHRRGVTPADGLFFLGLRWQYRRNSNFIDGVGADAAYLARHLSASRPVARHIA